MVTAFHKLFILSNYHNQYFLCPFGLSYNQISSKSIMCNSIISFLRTFFINKLLELICQKIRLFAYKWKITLLFNIHEPLLEISNVEPNFQLFLSIRITNRKLSLITISKLMLQLACFNKIL